MLLTKENIEKKLLKRKEKTNLDRVIGMKGIVTEEIKKMEVGEVKVDGKRWSAISSKNLPKGSTVKVLKIKGRSMIYVYQKEKLNKLCACKQIQNIFKQYDYNCTSLDTLILDLQKRLNDYDFPHEIGLFLGYPMTDVLGFIEGKEHLSVGYWKVYSHVKNCQHTFDKYHKCTHELCKRFNQGESVEQICRYV